MKTLDKYLNNLVYFLVVCCVISVSFAFSLETHRPFESIKEVLFHFFVLLACFFLVARSILAATCPVKKDLLYVFVLLYLCYNLLSFALLPYTDRVYFINLVLLILFFFVASVAINSETKYSYIIYAVGLVVGLSSIYSFFQIFGYDLAPFVNSFQREYMSRRGHSFFGNPNPFAAVLVSTLPLVLYGFFTRTGAARIFLAICFLLGVGGLLSTQTRAAFLGSSISIILFFFISFGKAHKRRYLWVVSSTFVLVVAGFLYTATMTEGTLGSRKLWWRNTLEIVEDYPLFGSGVGTFNVYYPAYRQQSPDIDQGYPTGGRLVHAHNEFLELLSDLGIVGFLLFWGVLFAFFYKYYVNWDPKKKYLIAGNCCAVMGLLIHNLYSQNLRFVFVAVFFWLNLALQPALVSEPRPEGNSTLNAGKVIGVFLLLPLLAMIFFNHSLKVFSADHYFMEGVAFSNAGDDRTAEPYFIQALDNYPQDKWALYQLGVSQFRLEKFAESKRTLLRLIQLDPNFLQSHVWLANNYFMTQEFQRAKVEFQESIRLDQEFGPAYYYLGLIAVRENDVEKAIEYFERIYALEGDTVTENLRVEALKNLVDINEQLGNEKKVELYTQELSQLGQ